MKEKSLTILRYVSFRYGLIRWELSWFFIC